jgi:hypothetical protein
MTIFGPKIFITMLNYSKVHIIEVILMTHGSRHSFKPRLERLQFDVFLLVIS